METLRNLCPPLLSHFISSVFFLKCKSDPSSPWGTLFQGSLITRRIKLSSTISSVPCLFCRPRHSPLPKCYCSFPKTPCYCTSLFFTHICSDFLFLSFETWFSGSLLWTPRALLQIFPAPISPCWILLTITLCLSHINVNSLKKFICGSSGPRTGLVHDGFIPWFRHIMKEGPFCIAFLVT